MDSARVEREAADWLARRDSGDWSEVNERAFADWQNEATAHRIAVIRIQTTWQRAERLQALGAGVPRGQIPAPGSWNLSSFLDRGQSAVSAVPPGAEEVPTEGGITPAQRLEIPAFGIRRRAGWAATVALAVCVAGAGYFLAYGPDTYKSDIGDIKVISLADGSTATLNTNTIIHVHLSSTSRRIDLERGEAYFAVARDPARPFVVSSAGEHVIAVGTQFSVFRRTSDTRVVVTEGKVKFEEFEGGAAVGPATELPAGSVAEMGAAGVVVKLASATEAEAYTSWKSGYITLNDTELALAVAEFNRYNRKQLVIGDPSIASLRVGGHLRATNVEAFVRVLEKGFPVRAQDLGDRIVLTGP